MDPITFYIFCRVTMMLGFGLGSIGDVFSTNAALAHGGKEANPLWRWAMGILGPKWVIPRVLLAQAIVWANVGNAFGEYVWWAALAAVVPLLVLGYVVWSNFRIAKTLREKARSNLQ